MASKVGNLTLRRGEPFTQWGIAYSGDAQDMDDPTVMLAATRDRPEGWNRATHLDMNVTFDAIAGPHYAVGGAQGHFEQTGVSRAPSGSATSSRMSKRSVCTTSPGNRAPGKHLAST